MPRSLTMPLSDTVQRTFDFHDGSHWQPDKGPFDAQKLAEASTDRPGVGRIISWKCSQGVAAMDPTFRSMRNIFAQQFDIRYFYHWLSSTSDPALQAAWYLSLMGIWGEGERCSIDAEEKGVTAEDVWTFAEIVEEITHRPSNVYTGIYVDGGRIWTHPRVRMSKYGPREMHLAAYISRSELIVRFTQLGLLDFEIFIWQYSSNGDYIPGQPETLPGVTGRGDLNHVCNWSIYGDPDLPPPPFVQEDVMYFSNADPRPATSSDPGHAWFELMPGGRARIVTDINDVLCAFGMTEAQCVTNTSVQRPNSVIDALLAKGPWVEPTTPSQPDPGAPPICPPFPVYTGQLGSVPGEITLTPQA